MALPTSPSVVVIENDISIYTPNVDSSIVGIVGFADKGPVNEATLITSQNNLVNKFGIPSTAIPGQALEGALEILEATNQVYFVRAGTTSSLVAASASIQLGFCPAVEVSAVNSLESSSIKYSVVDNYGVVKTSDRIVTLASSTGVTSTEAILKAYFNPDLLEDQDVFVTTDTDGRMFMVGRYAGSAASLTVSANNSTWTLSSLHASGYTSGISVTGITAKGGTINTNGVSSLYLGVRSIYPGTGYNLSSLRDGTVQGLSVQVQNKSIRDKLLVNEDGVNRENFLVVLSPSSPASVEYLLVSGDSNKSELIFTDIKTSGVSYTHVDNFANVLPIAVGTTFDGLLINNSFPRFIKPIEGTYNLSAGRSGYSTTETGSADDFTALIGTAAAKSGMNALDDDALNISLALVPGITNQSVQNNLITLAETSKNFVAIVSPPYGLSEVQDAVDWMNGRETRTAAINNSYAAVYWPWVQVFNFYAGGEEWYDPAIFAARQYVYTDNVSEPWFAPAGYRRGRLTKPVDVEFSLNQGDKDVLYVNNVNPITKEPLAGITIFGQKTAQRNPTALDRVNVRRLMIFIRKVLLQLGKPFQFEPNDQFTWELVEDVIRPFLDDLLARRAIVEGDVKCDATTNTPLRVDRNELWCAVTIKPTKAAETIVFEVNLTNQSATING